VNAGELATGSCPCSDGQVAIRLAIGPGGVLMIDSKQCTARSGPAVRGSRPAGPGPARRSTAMRVWLVTRSTGWWSSGCPPTHRSCTRSRACGLAARPCSWPTAPRRTSPRPCNRPHRGSQRVGEMPHVAYSFPRPHGPVGPRIAPAWPLPGQRLDLPSSWASVDRCVPGPSSPTPGIGRSGTPVPLGYVIVAAIQQRGPFHSGCCRQGYLERRRPGGGNPPGR
jgi:hypothetical protein